MSTMRTRPRRLLAITAITAALLVGGVRLTAIRGQADRSQQAHLPVTACALAVQDSTVQILFLTSGYPASTPGSQRVLDCFTLGQEPGLVPISDITPGAGYWCHFRAPWSDAITVQIFDTDPSGSGAVPFC